MAQAIPATPYQFYILYQWNQQAAEIIGQKHGNKIIALDNVTLNLKVPELRAKGNYQAKPIIGVLTRSVSATVNDSELFIKNILLQTREAVEDPKEPDKLLRPSFSLTSEEKIKKLDISNLTAKSFKEKASAILESDTGAWLTLLDAIQLLRNSQTKPSEEGIKTYLNTIQNQTKKLLSISDYELTGRKKQLELLNRIDTLQERIDKELSTPQLATDKKNKAKAKSQKAHDQQTIKEIRTEIDNQIQLINGSDSQESTAAQKEKTKTDKRKKGEKTESSALPENDKSVCRQGPPEPKSGVNLQKQNNPEKPTNMKSDNESDIRKLIDEMKDFIKLLPQIYDPTKANHDERNSAEKDITKYTYKITDYGINIPGQSAEILRQSLLTLFE